MDNGVRNRDFLGFSGNQPKTSDRLEFPPRFPQGKVRLSTGFGTLSQQPSGPPARAPATPAAGEIRGGWPARSSALSAPPAGARRCRAAATIQPQGRESAWRRSPRRPDSPACPGSQPAWSPADRCACHASSHRQPTPVRPGSVPQPEPAAHRPGPLRESHSSFWPAGGPWAAPP